jgi:hypothetical protein
MYPVNVKNKFLVAVLSLMVVFPTTSVYAEESRITNLEKEQPAPFAGVLMDKNTAAEILAREEYNKVECELKIKNQVEKTKAKNLLEMATLQASFDSLKEQNSSILKIKDAEILRLQELAIKNPNDNAHWWLAGGVVAGIVTSIAIFYAAVEVQNSE